MKKVLRSLCCVLAFVIGFAACSRQESGTSAPAGGGSATSSAPAVKTKLSDYYTPFDTPVKVTGAVTIAPDIKFREGENPNNSEWTRAWKEKINVELEFPIVASSANDYTTMLNLAISSGNCPNFFTLDFNRYHELVGSGYLADMTAAYAEWMPPIVKSKIESNEGVVPSITVDGKMYGVPRTVNGAMNVLYARKDWVENLGYKREDFKTVDDFIKLFYAIAEKDPDGNGKRDTYGFSLDKSLTSFYRLANAYNAWPTIWVEQPDGKLVNGLTLPETKQALAVAAQMFKDRIIDPEFGVKSANDIKMSIAANIDGIALTDTNNVGHFNTLQPNKNDLELLFWRLPDANGNTALGPTSATPGLLYVAKKDTPNPEAFIKLMAFWEDMVNGEDPSTAAIYHTQAATDGTSYLVFQQGFNFQHDGLSKNHLLSILVDQKIRNNDRAKDFSGPYAGQAGMYLDNAWRYLDDPTYTAGWQNRWGFGPDGLNMSVLPLEVEQQRLFKVSAFNKVPGPEMVELMPALDAYRDEFITKIIYGEIPLDDFEKCVNTWLGMGGQAVTDEINAQ